jgi:hypothetical protein
MTTEERLAALEQAISRDPPEPPLTRKVPLFGSQPGGPTIMVDVPVVESIGERISRYQPIGPDNLEGMDAASLDDLVRLAHRERSEPSIAVSAPGTIERSALRPAPGVAIDPETGRAVQRELTDRERADRRLIDQVAAGFAARDRQ